MRKDSTFWCGGSARLLGAVSLLGLVGGLATPAYAQDEPQPEIADTVETGPGEAGANDSGELAADAAQEEAGEELVVTGFRRSLAEALSVKRESVSAAPDKPKGAVYLDEGSAS